ncbi:Crp/Fnr family transcriptional regulator [Helicobacter mesocricetorum]|uniref:Crp/Fnr family transcriptional regulator n=1 Tax=Helicobacter mesocricetorum TaxID=87012 RepID=UPI000CF02F4E|nr:Crp/Fnr family transcriptional regulator [Helicobacter mesocricetorum]
MEALESFYPFCSLSKEEILALKEIVWLKKYQKGELIVYEEEKISSLYFLLQGEVKLYKVNRFDGEVFLGFLKQGFLIDYKQGFDAKSFANAECKTSSLVACFDAEKFNLLLEAYPKILQVFFKELLKKMALYEELIQRELVFDSTAKIAYVLKFHLRDFNIHKKNENAAFLNIQPETLSRILKKLHREGIIRTNKIGKIEVLDEDKLQMIFKQDAK